jgi:hypothetical protein
MNQSQIVENDKKEKKNHLIIPLQDPIEMAIEDSLLMADKKNQN